jgi:hypothetical protein
MSLAVRNIVWTQHPKLRHAFLGYIAGRRVMMLVDERLNPRRPEGGKVPAKPLTLEVYLPLAQGHDKILKFTTDTAAKAEAGRLLAKLVADIAEVL